MIGGGITGVFTAKIADAPIPEFVYYLYDHLGNTRVTYSVEVKTPTQIEPTVLSATDYYPYGKALRTYGKERYQSTYHERDVESGFDYRGARFYDSDVARFNSLDPHASDYASWSDYSYVLGNPLMLIDSDGKDPIIPKIYLVDFAGLDMDVISGHVRDIFAKNGFEVTTEIITPEQALAITPLDQQGVYGVSVINTPRQKDGPYQFLGHSEINHDLILLAWEDNGNIGTTTYVNSNEFSNAAYREYTMGYLASHEILHQMLEQAYLYYGYTEEEIKTMFASSDSDGEHYDSEPNLNKDGRNTKIPEGASDKLRPQEQILNSNDHKCLLQSFFSDVGSDNYFLGRD